MIILKDNYIKSFVDFLNKNFMIIDENVELEIMYGYETVGAEKNYGFGVYDTLNKKIYIADLSMIAIEKELTPQDIIRSTLENIAHEFEHHIQNIKGKEFDENEADMFAENIVKEYMTLK